MRIVICETYDRVPRCRVKGPPANQLPKQRTKLIFPSSSATVSVARERARESGEKRRVKGKSLDVYGAV